MLDPFDDFGKFGSLEEWIDEFAVFLVLGRVGFDGKLPHGTEVFLGRYGNAKGGIGTEGLPVLGRGPHVGVSQNHREGLALERTGKNPVVFAGFLEGIGVAHGEKLLFVADRFKEALELFDFFRVFCGEVIGFAEVVLEIVELDLGKSLENLFVDF